MTFYFCIAFDLIGLIYATKEQNKMKYIWFVHRCLFGKFTFYFEISLLRHSYYFDLAVRVFIPSPPLSWNPISGSESNDCCLCWFIIKYILAQLWIWKKRRGSEDREWCSWTSNPSKASQLPAFLVRQWQSAQTMSVWSKCCYVLMRVTVSIIFFCAWSSNTFIHSFKHCLVMLFWLLCSLCICFTLHRDLVFTSTFPEIVHASTLNTSWVTWCLLAKA